MGQDGASTSSTSGTIKSILTKGASGPGELLPVLHEIQDAIGFIPVDSVADIAGAFNLSRAEVHGVITFYHHFRTAPPGVHQVQICRAEACQSMGAEQLLAHAKQSLGCDLHGKSADGKFGLEPVYCLGQCATSPAMMINDDLFAKVTPARFDQIVSRLGKEQP
ncbi:MAG TPA: formate dehydrogenase subunit gamma [Burkholderiaceae bacterium]|jgi:formate dehydrogenase subunit gamma